MRYFKEILLAEAIIFIGLWITNEYLATLLTFICVPIIAGTLIVSLIAERLERSKIGQIYFYLMTGLILIPILIFIAMFIINEGTSFDWARE